MIRSPAIRLLIAVSLWLLGATPARAQVTYARDPATIVVRLTEVPGEIGEQDGGPSVAIHGDGRAVVHYPAYMQRAGDYETHLAAAEMDRLLGLIVAGGLLDFDPAALRRATREADAAARTAAATEGRPRTAHVELDAATTRLDVRVDGVAKTIVWTGVQSTAARYPALAAVQGLAEVERELRTLMERSDLTRLR